MSDDGGVLLFCAENIHKPSFLTEVQNKYYKWNNNKWGFVGGVSWGNYLSKDIFAKISILFHEINVYSFIYLFFGLFPLSIFLRWSKGKYLYKTFLIEFRK